MNGYRPLILLLALSATVGCHYRDPSVDLLEAELRWMEDQLYMMEDELHQRCAQLDKCQEECPAPTPADLPRAVTDPQAPRALQLPIESIPQYEIIPHDPSPEYPSPDSFAPLEQLPQRPELEMPIQEQPVQEQPVPERPSLDSPPLDSPTLNGGPTYEIVPPDVFLPNDTSKSADPLSPIPAQPLDSQPQLADPPPQDRPLLEGDQPPNGAAGDKPAALDFSFRDNVTRTSLAAANMDAHVTHIVAQAELSSGRGFDDEATDADILVVIEPRNKNGQYVELAGPVSVVVLDGHKIGSAARIARWDYDAGSARRAIRSSALGEGIHLQLRWPEEVPDSDDLHIFVRYTTVEDKRLEADLRLEVDTERAMNGQWRVVDRSGHGAASPEPAARRAASWLSPRETPANSRGSGGFQLRPIDPPDAQPLRTTQVEPLELEVLDDPSVEPGSWTATQAIAKPEWSPYR